MAKPSILVCDDEPNLQAAVRLILERDYELSFASDGEDALKQFQRKPADLVLLDIKMPGLNGLEVLKHVRATTPQIGVFLLTGYDDDALEKQALELGALGIIHKPPAFAEVRQLVNDALVKLPPA